MSQHTTVPGEILRAWRRSRGWDKNEMARRLRHAAGEDEAPAHASLVRMVHYWESGQRPLSERHELLYGKALGIEPDALAQGPDGLGLPPVQAGAEQGPENGNHLDLLGRFHHSAAVDEQVIAILRGGTEDLRQLDRRLGAPAVIGKTRAHAEHLATCLRYALSSQIRRDLASLLGQSLTLAGWQSVDLGQLHNAWDYYESAKGAAREAGDSSLLCHATAEQAYVLLEAGATGKALKLIQETYSSYQRTIPPQLRSWLKAAEAEIAAIGGDERTARYSLEAAAMSLNRADDGHRLPYLTFDAVHLARWKGNCLAYFGDPATVQDLSNVLGTMDQSFTRAAAGVHCDLARALFALGEKHESALHLEKAGHLALMTGSMRHQRKVDQLRRLAE